MTRDLSDDLAEMERTDPAIARAVENYNRMSYRLRSSTLEPEEWDAVRLMAIGCAEADNARGVPWCCRCVWCRLAIKEIARRAIEREARP